MFLRYYARMAAYYALFLDKFARVITREDFLSRSDDAAILTARTMRAPRDSHTFEVWELGRRVYPPEDEEPSFPLTGL
jgi:hypothetical protein